MALSKFVRGEIKRITPVEASRISKFARSEAYAPPKVSIKPRYAPRVVRLKGRNRRVQRYAPVEQYQRIEPRPTNLFKEAGRRWLI